MRFPLSLFILLKHTDKKRATTTQGEEDETLTVLRQRDQEKDKWMLWGKKSEFNRTDFSHLQPVHQIRFFFLD